MTDMKNGKTVCVMTNGCPENRIDGAMMQGFFMKNGWIVTDKYEDADVILFNTCGLTKDSQDGSIKIINRIKENKKSSAELIVCGCLSKINKERLDEVYDGITFGSDEVEKLPDIIGEKRIKTATRANHLIPRINVWRFPSLSEMVNPVFVLKLLTRLLYAWPKNGNTVFNPQTYYIKVSTGCLDACSYCGVKFSRGKLRSKPLSAVIEEFDEGLANGYTDFALIATDLGAYGRDYGITLATLLEEMVKRDGEYKIMLRNVHPRYLIEMMPDLWEIFRSGKISYLGAAVQSGNDRILRLMKRRYSVDDFKRTILTMNNEFPEIRLNTQIMVGFPSETDEEFSDTIRLLDDIHFDFVEVYIYQDRPRTRASKIEESVPRSVATRRFYRLYFRSLFKEYKVLVW